MNRGTCSINGCNGEERAAGMCTMHYKRVRKTGHPGPVGSHRPRLGAPCADLKCTSPVRLGTPFCPQHFDDLRQGGILEEPGSSDTGTCLVVGCEHRKKWRGVCSTHTHRIQHHGHPSGFTPHKERDFPRGARNPKWTGDDATYFAIHQRLKYVRGAASSHQCGHCGIVAEQWAYDHADPDERTSLTGPYSTNLEHYIPLCTSCHKTFDLRFNPPAISPIDLDAVRQLHAEGVRVLAMSKILGVGRKRIDRALDDLGLPHFRPGTRSAGGAA